MLPQYKIIMYLFFARIQFVYNFILFALNVDKAKQLLIKI